MDLARVTRGEQVVVRPRNTRGGELEFSMEPHPLSKFAKDVGSAAVMFSLVIAGMIWLAILWPVLAGWARSAAGSVF